MNVAPENQTLLTKSSIPFGAVIHPMNEGDRVPIVDFGSCGVIRCKKCRTYINCFVQFVESGRKWKCNVCQFANEVPHEYWSEINQTTGQRADMKDRPELQFGCVEMCAPAEYMVRPPMPPTYVFLFDVSHPAVASGAFETAVDTVRSLVQELPGKNRTQIAVLTYDRAVHFYNLSPNLAQPQMLVVSDTQDVFLPLNDDMLVRISECKTLIDKLLERLPAMHRENKSPDSALGAALKAAYEMTKTTGGRVFVFQSSLPSLEQGKLTIREDPKKVGTDKEVELLVPPNSSFYKNLALDCNRQQITVDMFVFPQRYIDIGTIGCLPQITGGFLNYYPGFFGQEDRDAFAKDLRKSLTQPTAWEAVMRIRASKGIQVSQHYGNFFIRSTDLLSLPSCDSLKAFGAQFTISETLATRNASIQAALLYTNSRGERRIRVMTRCIPVTQSLADIFKHAHSPAVVNLLTKMGMCVCVFGGFRFYLLANFVLQQSKRRSPRNWETQEKRSPTKSLIS